MKVSTRGRYGLRAMLELAGSFGRGPVVVMELAERQGLSRKYLHSLLSTLKDAGLVEAIRGPGGGFVLSRSPAEIRLSDVLRAVEGPFALVDCVDNENYCERSDGCVARGVWGELSVAIEEMLKGITLKDLITSSDGACPSEVALRRDRSTLDPQGTAGCQTKKGRHRGTQSAKANE